MPSLMCGIFPNLIVDGKSLSATFSFALVSRTYRYIK